MSGMLSFLPPLKNNYVTIGLNFLLDSKSAIISSSTIDTLLFFVGFIVFQIFININCL